VRGTWVEGFFTRTRKDMLGKALEIGVFYHRVPAFGEHRDMLLS